jgi:hypothetical protein
MSMTRGRSIAGALFLATGLALVESCTSTEPIPSSGLLKTDASWYLADPIESSGTPPRRHFRVITRFENTTSVPLYLGRCFPDSPRPLFTVAVADTKPRDSAYGQIWGCVGHSNQFQIVPGAFRVDTFDVSGPNEFPSGNPVGIGTVQGLFQMFFDVRLEPGDGAEPAPREFEFSNVFNVVLRH